MLERGAIVGRIGFDMKGSREGGSSAKSRYNLAFGELVRAGRDEYGTIRSKYPDVFERSIGAEFNLTPQQEERVRNASIADLNLPNNRVINRLRQPLRYQQVKKEGVQTLGELLTQRTWEEVSSTEGIGIKSLARLRTEITKFIENEDYKKGPSSLAPRQEHALEILNDLADKDPSGEISIDDFIDKLGRSPARAYALLKTLREKGYTIPPTRRKK